MSYGITDKNGINHRDEGGRYLTFEFGRPLPLEHFPEATVENLLKHGRIEAVEGKKNKVKPDKKRDGPAPLNKKMPESTQAQLATEKEAKEAQEKADKEKAEAEKAAAELKAAKEKAEKEAAESKAADKAAADAKAKLGSD